MTSAALLSWQMLRHPGWAAGTHLVTAYEQAFVAILLGGTGHALALGRGRVALWVILRSLGVEETSEVVVPAYTCETVPMAVKFAGAKCVYVDTEPEGYNVRVEDAADAMTKHTGAILCQHTYGLVQPVRDWLRVAGEGQAALIEDRCQLIRHDGVEEGGLPGRHAAYFSTHFNKPFSTTQGGMAVFHDLRMYSAALGIREHLPVCFERRRARSLALQTLLYALAGRSPARALVGRLYRWAQRSGLIRGTISRTEYGGAMPPDYLSRATNFHATLGMAALRRWQEDCRHREELTAFYLEQLERLGANTTALRAGCARPILLMVPVLVENKTDVLRHALHRGLPIGTWFDRPPAHIRPASALRYDYTPGRCPHAEYRIAREIHLPTAPWVSLGQAQRAVRFLEHHARLADPLPRLRSIPAPTLAVTV